MEGDPEIRGRRLKIARQIALQRLQTNVPKANVIVTNPTHYAIALQYDPKTMAAPKVVAKGADFMAMRIREIAAAHKIPVVERPPLARALYSGVPVGRQIKPEFYEAVAEILAYVYRLQGKAA
jgi:flagellar biosynthetic protein FlhB